MTSKPFSSDGLILGNADLKQTAFLRPGASRKPRILIVEDVMLIALDFSDQLAELGYEVVGPASRLQQGLDLVASGSRIDGALLDINLAGELCYPIATQLRARRIPFAFVSGERALGIPREFQDVVLLAKPVAAGEIKAVLDAFKTARGRYAAAEHWPLH